MDDFELAPSNSLESELRDTIEAQQKRIDILETRLAAIHGAAQLLDAVKYSDDAMTERLRFILAESAPDQEADNDTD